MGYSPSQPPPPPPIYPVGLSESNIFDVTRLTNNETDGAIAINPRSPANLFVAANTNVEAGVFGAYSTNSGTNWSDWANVNCSWTNRSYGNERHKWNEWRYRSDRADWSRGFNSILFLPDTCKWRDNHYRKQRRMLDP